jgi:hypothetical protein
MGNINFMLDTLITSKTRVKLLLKFFLNPSLRAYLRGLSEEFGDSTNSLRLELNRLEDAGILVAEEEGARKLYRANCDYPFFTDIQRLLHRYTGLDRILESVVQRLEGVEAVYVTGDLARGIKPNTIELVLKGQDFDVEFVDRLCLKASEMLAIQVTWHSIGAEVEPPVGAFSVHP